MTQNHMFFGGRPEDRSTTAAGEFYWLFDTAIGFCGLRWSDRGLTRRSPFRRLLKASVPANAS